MAGDRLLKEKSVLHVPFTYWPDAIGGTEVFVRSLARCLDRHGVRSIVAAPGAQHAEYRQDGIEVIRYALPVPTLDQIHGADDPRVFKMFGRILDRARPDLVHLHAFSYGVSMSCVAAIAARDIPMVSTYHTPTQSCVRGDMRRFGGAACDGVLREAMCTQCALHSHSVPIPVSMILGRLPLSPMNALGRLFPGTKLEPALRMRNLVAVRHAATVALWKQSRRVIAVCTWVRELLIANGVPPSKIVLSRQGVDCAPENFMPARRSADDLLRLGYFGRIENGKGIATLIDALEQARAPSLRVDLHVSVQSQGDERRLADWKGRTKNDSRIRWLSAIPHEQVISTMSQLDFVVVPSEWLETGPLVVLESFAAGVPVLGARLGGIAELVRDGVDGRLLEPGQVTEWAQALECLAANPLEVAALRSGVRAPRTMRDVAVDHAQIYAELMAS